MGEEARPFKNDLEFIEAEASWLQARVARIELERELSTINAATDARVVGEAQQVRQEELTRQIGILREREKSLRAALDARLKTHREDPESLRIGIYALKDSSGLSHEECRILLILTIAAMPPSFAGNTLGTFAPAYRGIPVGDIAMILELKDLSGWMRIRKLFHPTAALLRDGLITLDYPASDNRPGDLWLADAALTMQAFNTITGQMKEDGHA